MGAIPAGFRPSTLFQLLEEGTRCPSASTDFQWSRHGLHLTLLAQPEKVVDKDVGSHVSWTLILPLVLPVTGGGSPDPVRRQAHFHLFREQGSRLPPLSCAAVPCPAGWLPHSSPSTSPAQPCHTPAEASLSLLFFTSRLPKSSLSSLFLFSYSFLDCPVLGTICS